MRRGGDLLGRGVGNMECPVLFLVPHHHFLFHSAAAYNMLINMPIMIPLYLSPMGDLSSKQYYLGVILSRGGEIKSH